jgi:flagellar M-ring protein FliF
MNVFTQLWEQVRTIVKGMSWGRRALLIALTAAVLVGVVGVVIYASQPEYRVLYSNLSPEDAGAVTAKLQSRSVPYKLSANGTTVSVPADQVAQLRLDLAVEGLPAKPKGFELFDEMSLGMTPFQQHVNYDRALQAELARTIMQVEPIAFARVHLARPDPTPFVREQKPVTASVVLKLKPGTSLGRKTAAGIVALVARSVEGLSPENVALMDTSGKLLTEAKSGEVSGPVSTQLEYRRELEAYLSARAEEMLARVLGPGRAVVRVTAEVSFQHQKTKRETYDPDQRVLVKETITSRKSSNGAPGARGVAGTGSNLPGGKGATTVAPAHNHDNEENTDSEWRATKVEQEMEEGRGTVERLTVAGLVDLSRPEGDTGPGLTAAQAEEVIKQAVGFKAGRDVIKVNDVKMAPAAAGLVDGAEREYLDGQKWRWYMALARSASLGLLALVVGVFGLLFYRRLRPVKAPPPPPPPQGPDRLARLVLDDPDGVARVLAAWLDEPAPAVAASAERRAA